ncbi:unnamed protein product, partial [Polarella glacialis]
MRVLALLAFAAAFGLLVGAAPEVDGAPPSEDLSHGRVLSDDGPSGDGGSVITVSPAAVDIEDDRPSVHRQTLELSNTGSKPLTARLALRFDTAKRRQLADQQTPMIVHFGDDPAKTRGTRSGRRAQEEPEKNASVSKPTNVTCSHVGRLLLRPRRGPGEGAAVGESRRLAQDRSRRLARRLESEVEGLNITGWQHLEFLGIDIAELNCSFDPDDILNRVRNGFAADLEFVELDSKSYFPIQDSSTMASSSIPDALWQSQWGMRRVGLPEAWQDLEARSDPAETVIVAVLDTGVTMNHEDLVGRIWTNPNEVPNNGIDDDGNGLVDDVHGYDFVDNDPDPSDSDGHGTHCAGVIAANQNSIGISGAAGANTNIKIMPLRFLTGTGGYTSDAILSLNYAVAMGATISSNSWGGTTRSEALEAAVRSAQDVGHLFIAAAGNSASNNDFQAEYPCNYDDVLCVAATESAEALAPYSNRGVQSVNIAAPGSDIKSCYLGASSYSTLSGTSMATPLVAGSVALVWSWLGNRLVTSLQDLRSLMLESADRLSWTNGWVESGMLN